MTIASEINVTLSCVRRKEMSVMLKILFKSAYGFRICCNKQMTSGEVLSHGGKTCCGTRKISPPPKLLQDLILLPVHLAVACVTAQNGEGLSIEGFRCPFVGRKKPLIR